MNRDIVQKEAKELLLKYNNVLLRWATGVGKSLAFIKMQESINPKKVYIVVAERAHIDNWKKDYIKHGKESLLANVEIFCYASLKKYVNTNADMICLDEGHHALSLKRMEALQSIQTNKIILLSATLNKNHQLLLNSTLGQFHEHTVSLKQAISNNILPKPTINLVPLILPEDSVTTTVFTRGKSTKRKTINCNYKDRYTYINNKDTYPDLHLIITCTHREKNTYLEGMIEFYKRRYFSTKKEFFKTKWLLLGSERKRFLSEAKTNTINQLINKITDKRFICFSGSIEQATILSNNTNVIHSKVKNSLDIINSFNEGNISHLFVVEMLKEGQNLNNIEIGIISQLDGDSGAFIQKVGRVMRAENPVIFIFYYKNTRDEDYLNNVLQEVDKDHICIIEDLDNFNIN